MITQSLELKRRDWKELRASLVEDFGEEYVREHFTDY